MLSRYNQFSYVNPEGFYEINLLLKVKDAYGLNLGHINLIVVYKEEIIQFNGGMQILSKSYTNA